MGMKHFFLNLWISLIWVKAQRAYRRGDKARAIDLIHKMQSLQELLPFHLAFLATLQIEIGGREVARRTFKEASAKLGEANSANAEYTRMYCHIYLHAMDDGSDLEGMTRRALQVPCDALLKKWLPLDVAAARKVDRGEKAPAS
jgi:hypothetical protein